MKNSAYTTYYNDAYLIRVENRRIAVRLTETGNWHFCFTRCWPQILSEKDLSYYEGHIIRMGRTITEKHMFLSTEAMELISHGFLYFTRVHKKELELIIK